MAEEKGIKVIMNAIGPTAFVVGIALCIIVAFIKNPLLISALLVIGVIVGLLNITAEEVVKLLLSIIGIIVGSEFLKNNLTANIVPAFLLSPILEFLNALIIFLSPALLIVGIKTVIEIARD
jgi:hypothetical protein